MISVVSKIANFIEKASACVHYRHNTEKSKVEVNYILHYILEVKYILNYKLFIKLML